MRTFSLVKGLPIYGQGGYKLGHVFELCLTESGNVQGVILQRGAIFKKSLFIHLKDVFSFGKDGIIISDQAVLEEMQQEFMKEDSILGKSLMTSKGEELGVIEDVYFQEELGTIVGYECSDGFFTDISEGKRIIKAESPPKIGKDAIIVNIGQ